MSEELSTFKTIAKMFGFDVKVDPIEEVKEVVEEPVEVVEEVVDEVPVVEAVEKVEEKLTPVVVTESAKVSGRPPVSSVPAGFTIESIHSLPDEDIIKNWAAIRGLLSK